MGVSEGVILTQISKRLEELIKEQRETNRLLRVLAGGHEHRWFGPDMDGPMRCKICGEPY